MPSPFLDNPLFEEIHLVIGIITTAIQGTMQVKVYEIENWKRLDEASLEDREVEFSVWSLASLSHSTKSRQVP